MSCSPPPHTRPHPPRLLPRTHHNPPPRQDPNVTYGSVMRNTVKNTGMTGFYRGLSSMVYFAAPKAAIRFGAFEFCSGLLSTADGGDKYGLGAVSAAF